jgi:hypothetical protein
MSAVLVTHRWLAYLVMLLLTAVMLAGVALRLIGRDESPTALRVLQHWTENTLLLQVAVGAVLFLAGRRVTGDGAFLHYLYGSLFPLVAIIGGRIAALRRERHDYVGLAWGAFFALGLTARAVLLGLASTGRSFGDLF